MQDVHNIQIYHIKPEIPTNLQPNVFPRRIVFEKKTLILKKGTQNVGPFFVFVWCKSGDRL